MPVVVVFRSVRREDGQEAYETTSARMVELARGMPGFLDIHSVRDPDTREGITVARFVDEESVAEWRRHLEHVGAQEAGRTDFYESYEVVVGQEIRRYDWARQG